MKKRYKKSTIVPVVLFFYLCFMAYIGRDLYFAGEYLHYFGIIGVTLLILILLHFSLRRREKIHKKNEESNYGTRYGHYSDAEGGNASEQQEETKK